MTRKQLYQLSIQSAVIDAGFVLINLYPLTYSSGAPRCYGCPFPYRLEDVTDRLSVFADGGTIDHPHAKIIWKTSDTDDSALLADAGIAAFVVMIAGLGWFAICRRVNRGFP